MLLLQAEPSTASRVLRNLWQGSAPPIGLGVAQHFDALVLCAKEYQLPPENFPGVNVLHAPMNDDGTPMTPEEMKIAVQTAGRVISLLVQGRRVLITCRQGRNRSGMISTLAMCLGPPKFTPEHAVMAVRAARGPGAMQNRYFLSFLKRYTDFLKRQSANSLI
jgi:protein-tyrosine phosphatase